MRTIDFAELRSGSPNAFTQVKGFLRDIERRSRGRRILIIEISGLDSLAAALIAAQTDPKSFILPTIATVPTEEGDVARFHRQARRTLLREMHKEQLYPLLGLRDTEFWHALNGAYLPSILRRFEFFSPCPGCHIYVHALRILLARILGASTIVSGERLSHSGRRKINQTAISFRYHQSLFMEYALKLETPLKNVSSQKRLPGLLKDQYDKGLELKCVFRSGVRDEAGAEFDLSHVTSYYRHYLLPAARGYLDHVLSNWNEGKRRNAKLDRPRAILEVVRQVVLNHPLPSHR